MADGWAPIPTADLDGCIKAAVATGNRPLATRLILYRGTCRKNGFQGLQVGQIAVTVKCLAMELNCNQGNASRLLQSVMRESGLCRLGEGVLGPIPTATHEGPETLSLKDATATATPTATQSATPILPETLGLNDGSATLTATPSASEAQLPYRMQDSILNTPTLKDPSLRSGSPLVGKETVQGVVDCWNRLTKDVAPFAQCSKLNPQRERAIRKCLKDPWWVENLEAGITAMIHDQWLLKGGSDGTFRPGIDYLCREKTLPAAIEKASAQPPKNGNGTPTGSRAASDAAYLEANSGKYNPPVGVTEEELSNAVNL